MSICDCGYAPTVIVPGIGQSRVDMVDEKGNKIKSAWPLDVKGSELMDGLKGPFMKMMMLRRDMGFSEKLSNAIRRAAEPIARTDEGEAISRLRVVNYPYSVDQCNEEEKAYIYKMVPLEELAEKIGEDHLFFYAYHSFGSVYDNADGLHDFIQMVKKSTGHDKVNLIPVSLGGAVSTAYLDAYGDRGDIDRVLYFVAALDGSQVVADLLTGNLFTDDVEPLLKELAGGNSKQLVDIFKMMPSGVPEKVLDKLIDTVLDTVILKSTMMWAILPCKYYEDMRDKYISDKKYARLREQTDRFHEAHMNLKNILKREVDRGVRFYNICGYGRQLPPFVRSNKLSSDGMINIDSASIGAHSAPLGESFPEAYVQQNINCTNSEHNHISPDRCIDASTGFFPDTTWYFHDQVHDDVAFNDIALAIASKVLTEDDFNSVFVDPAFPQFNKARNIKKIKYELLPKARKADRSKLFPGQITALDEALERAEVLTKNTLAVNNEEVAEVERLLAEAVELISSDNN